MWGGTEKCTIAFSAVSILTSPLYMSRRIEHAPVCNIKKNINFLYTGNRKMLQWAASPKMDHNALWLELKLGLGYRVKVSYHCATCIKAWRVEEHLGPLYMFRRIEYGPVYAACIIQESIGFSGLQKFLTHLSRRLKKLHASLLAENMSRRGRIVWWV